MTRADLVEEVSKAVMVTRKEAGHVVSTVLDGIADALRNGEKVEIRGFGSFRTRTRPARTGRNPKSGKTVQVPAKTIPYFKPSKHLREAVLATFRSED